MILSSFFPTILLPTYSLRLIGYILGLHSSAAQVTAPMLYSLKAESGKYGRFVFDHPAMQQLPPNHVHRPESTQTLPGLHRSNRFRLAAAIGECRRQKDEVLFAKGELETCLSRLDVLKGSICMSMFNRHMCYRSGI
jgi:hypothetical protein